MQNDSRYRTRHIPPITIGGTGKALTTQEFEAWEAYRNGHRLDDVEAALVQMMKRRNNASLLPSDIGYQPPAQLPTVVNHYHVAQSQLPPPPIYVEPKRNPIDWEDVSGAFILIAATAAVGVVLYFAFVLLMDFAAFIKDSQPWSYAIIFAATTFPSLAFIIYNHQKHRRYDDFV